MAWAVHVTEVLVSFAAVFLLMFAVKSIRPHWEYYRYIRKFGGRYDPFYGFVLLQVAYSALRDHLRGGDPYTSVFRTLKELTEEGKSSFVVYSGFEANVAIYRAEEVEAFVSHSENISKPFIIYDMVNPWLKRGLLTSTGSKWRSRRKMLTPAFHFKILDSFAAVMNHHARILTEQLGSRIDDDIVPPIQTLTLKIICETVMGVNLDTYEREATRDYLDAMRRMGELLLLRVISPYQWPEWLYRWTPSGSEAYGVVARLHHFSKTVIEERQAYFENDPEALGNLMKLDVDESFKCKKPFLDLLLKEHFNKRSQFTIEDIREEVDTFMFEGHDTTAQALSFALFLIGHHPEVQQRIHKELDEVLGIENNDCDIDLDQLRQLKYLECVVKESLRIYPSVPLVGRRITKEYQLNGKTVPRGSNVYCFIFALHRDPRYFPEPERFDPDRFLPEKSAGRHPFAFLPFSAGARNCIGQKFALREEKIILAWILRRYNLQSMMPRDDIKLYTELVLRSKCGLPVKCTPRSRNSDPVR
ncbi:cytochrome P450 4V2-like [Galendromus occidentalis]|uniref:Cytochrome P450 4V2-like n=1 Tax=Galendromus occidentalis TaxID=34638 RepID=A0AAJ6VZG1_9ACAR|nr:cytochrome P450 4V2-like [Galendromus occidentalis]